MTSSSGGGSVTSSFLGQGQTETVHIRRNDTAFADESFDIYIEIRWYDGTSNQQWTLNVLGNGSASIVTCN